MQEILEEEKGANSTLTRMERASSKAKQALGEPGEKSVENPETNHRAIPAREVRPSKGDRNRVGSSSLN